MRGREGVRGAKGGGAGIKRKREGVREGNKQGKKKAEMTRSSGEGKQRQAKEKERKERKSRR